MYSNFHLVRKSTRIFSTFSSTPRSENLATSYQLRSRRPFPGTTGTFFFRNSDLTILSAHQTSIVLPIFQEHSFSATVSNLCHHINDLNPSLLLFLRRLRNITVRINSYEASLRTGWTERVYIRNDVDENLVRVFVIEKKQKMTEEVAKQV